MADFSLTPRWKNYIRSSTRLEDMGEDRGDKARHNLWGGDRDMSRLLYGEDVAPIGRKHGENLG
jgi:hypothetical protein